MKSSIKHILDCKLAFLDNLNGSVMDIKFSGANASKTDADQVSVEILKVTFDNTTHIEMIVAFTVRDHIVLNSLDDSYDRAIYCGIQLPENLPTLII